MASAPQPLTAPQATTTDYAFYEQLESYPWSSDPEFQSGLTAILGPDASSTNPSLLEDLTLRARCFYYTRKYNVPVDFPSYKAWREKQDPSRLSTLAPTTESLPLPSSPDPSPRSNRTKDVTANIDTNGADVGSSAALSTQTPQVPQTEPDYPASFAEVMELIKTGQPIPGIKDIPDTVLVGQGSEATQSKRRKPWEKSGTDVDDAQGQPRLFTTE